MITELVGYHRLLQTRLPVGCPAEPRETLDDFVSFSPFPLPFPFRPCATFFLLALSVSFPFFPPAKHRPIDSHLPHRPSSSCSLSLSRASRSSCSVSRFRSPPFLVILRSSFDFYSYSLATRNERSCFLSGRRATAPCPPTITHSAAECKAALVFTGRGSPR